MASAAGSKPGRAPILDLNKYIDQQIRVKFLGGREVVGVLKGYDPLVNLVLDECKETLREVNDPQKLTNETRFLGLLVARGTSVTLLSPIEGMQEISNPFIQAQQQEGQQV